MKATQVLVLSLLVSSAVVWAQTLAATAPVVVPARTVAPAPAQTPAPVAAGEVTRGKAAWYGTKFNGRKTASGQRFNAGALTAASNTLPFGTLLRVTNVKNKKSVTLHINDRGPKQPDRIIDVTRAAAAKLGILKSGVAEVELKVVGPAKGRMAKTTKIMSKVAKKK